MGFIVIFLTLILSFSSFAQGGGGHGGGGPGIILNMVSDFEAVDLLGLSEEHLSRDQIIELLEGNLRLENLNADYTESLLGSNTLAKSYQVARERRTYQFIEAGEVVDLESSDPEVGLIDTDMALELYAERIKRIDGKVYIREDAPILNYQDSLGVVRTLD